MDAYNSEKNEVSITATLPLKIVKYIGCIHCAFITGGFTSLVCSICGFSSLSPLVIFISLSEFFISMIYLQPLTAGPQAINYCYYRNNIKALSYDNFVTSFLLCDSNNLFSESIIEENIKRLESDLYKKNKLLDDDLDKLRKLNEEEDYNQIIFNKYIGKINELIKQLITEKKITLLSVFYEDLKYYLNKILDFMNDEFKKRSDNEKDLLFKILYKNEVKNLRNIYLERKTEICEELENKKKEADEYDKEELNYIIDDMDETLENYYDDLLEILGKIYEEELKERKKKIKRKNNYL